MPRLSDYIVRKTKGFFCFLFSNKDLQKIPLENWDFWIPYFSKTKRKSTKTITQRCFSCQNKSVCQKLARSCKKWKLAQKAIYALFAWNPSIVKFSTNRNLRGEYWPTSLSIHVSGPLYAWFVLWIVGKTLEAGQIFTQYSPLVHY